MIINESTKVRLGYLGTMEGKSMYEVVRNNPEPIIELYENNEPDDKKYLDMSREFFKVNKDVYSYYFFAKGNSVDIFVEMPLVKDDELFKWIRRDWGRTKALWCQLHKGNLRFNCSYHLATKSVHINVMWDNANLKNIWLKNATNEDILEAIKEWSTDFEGEVFYAIENADLTNKNSSK